MPRKVLWWVLKGLNIKEWAVCVVQAIYSNARNRARVNGRYSEDFGVGVCVRRGPDLSPLLFILVLEALPYDICPGLQ